MNTKLGRFQVAEPLSALAQLQVHDPEKVTLKTVDHEPKIGVLDQENLITQGINVASFIPGAPAGVTALGSCTANTEAEALSNVLDQDGFAMMVANQGVQPVPANPYSDTVAGERAAIGIYHGETFLTGQTSEEYPPTDCGSSGPYMYQYALSKGWISGQAVAHGADNIASVMQPDGACWGTPWMQIWFEPDSQGFIDGNGTAAALEAAIKSGVAGGHELYLSAIEKLAFYPTGLVNPFDTVLRFRNHWTKSWGDNGSGRVHLSTLVMLGSHIDVRRLIGKQA